VSARQDIAAAVTLTADIGGQPISITGHAMQPDGIGPWDAWAAWVSTRWISAAVREYVYNVIVALPAADAGTYVPGADDVVEAVGAALYSKGIWPGMSTPVQILLANQAPMPAVQIQVTI
jgi:hypothetical protein